MRQVGHHARRGFHPLDVALGLVGDRFSWNVLTMAARLATKLSFAEARATLAAFVPDAPSTEVIEHIVLGLGRHTAAWFEHAPAPDGDGEVLVIMFDGKGAATATESDLSRRRGKRRRRQLPASPRNRGRHHRRRYGKKPRRKKGDKSKNARIATMVVMYGARRWANRSQPRAAGAGERIGQEHRDRARRVVDVAAVDRDAAAAELAGHRCRARRPPRSSRG